MMYKYFNEYPVLINDALYQSQDQIKRVIKQFDDAMKAAGLVRSSDNGQLDTTNIPNLDILNGVVVEKSSGFYRTTGTFVQYQPLIYCFADTLQATRPIYIKITFEIGRYRYYPSTNLPANTVPTVPLALTTFINVGNTTDGNGNISNPMIFYHGPISVCTDANYNTKYYGFTNYMNRNSIINYQKEKGLLHINVCPGYRVGSTYDTGLINGVNNNMNNSLVKLIVFRLNDDTIGVFGAGGATNRTNSDIPVQYLFRYLNGTTLVSDTTPFTVSGFYNTTASYVNGKIVLAPINGYDPVKKLMVRYPYILLGSSADTGYITGANLQVNLSSTEKYNYYVYSGIDSGFSFASNTNSQSQNLLIYSGNDKYDY